LSLFADLLPFFRWLQDTQNSVKLLNLFRGVPIIYDAQVKGVGDGAIQVSTTKYQIACLYRDRTTFLLCAEPKVTLYADVLRLDVANLEASLGNFSDGTDQVLERQNVRVEPAEPLPVLVQPKSTRMEVQGELINISKTGMSLYLDRLLFSPRTYAPGEEMLVALTFPEVTQTTGRTSPLGEGADPMSRFSRDQIRGTSSLTGSSFNRPRPATVPQTGPLRTKIRAEVVNTGTDIGFSRVRLGLKIYPDDTARAAITRFIAQRQSEIIREIKSIYDLMNRFQA
jgi:hypothetical protein